MKTLRDIWFIAMNSLRMFATDRRALFFSIAFPFMFIALFNFLMSGVTQQDNRLELHMVTLENSSGLTRHIIEDLETEDESKLKPGETKIAWDKCHDRA